jgi:hypothetical protein
MWKSRRWRQKRRQGTRRRDRKQEKMDSWKKGIRPKRCRRIN